MQSGGRGHTKIDQEIHYTKGLMKITNMQGMKYLTIRGQKKSLKMAKVYSEG